MNDKEDGDKDVKSEMVYIISNHICEVNIDVEGDHILMLKSVSGILRTPVLKAGDYFNYIKFDEVKHEERKTDLYTQMDPAGISSIYSSFIDYDAARNKFKYKRDIIECSTRFKYVLGISKLPVKAGDYSDSIPFGNGPSYFILSCDKLTSSGTMYPNMFSINQLFTLCDGPGWGGDDMRHVQFSIRGLYNELVEIDSDLLWTFELTPYKDDGDKKNRTVRFTNEFK